MEETLDLSFDRLLMMMIMRFGYLRANPTNATTHVTTPLCSHWYTPTYMVQPSRGHPQEVLIHFVTWSTKYLSRCKYQIAQRCAVSTGLGRLNGTAVPDKWRLRRWIIYIYIYTHTHTHTHIHICGCVCVRASLPASFRVQRLAKKDSCYSDLCRRNLLANFLEFSLHKTKQTKLLKCSSWSESSLCHVLLLQKETQLAVSGMLQLKHTHIESKHESLQ